MQQSLFSLPDRIAFFGESSGAFQIILRSIKNVDRRQLAPHDEVHHGLEVLAFCAPDSLLDRGVNEWWTGGEQTGNFPNAFFKLPLRQDFVDETPAMSFVSVDPATGQQKIHGYVVWNAFREPDTCRVSNGSGANFGKRKG